MKAGLFFCAKQEAGRFDRRRVQAHALLSSLNMLIETAGGFEYTAAQCREWMSHVGFRDIRRQPLDDVHTAVIGIKGDR